MRKDNSKHWLIIGLCVAALGLVALTQVSFGQQQEFIPERTSLDDHPPRMVSAFFGIDNDLPLRRPRSTPGRDGMPVTFSRQVEEPIDPAAFTIITRSGARHQPVVATTRPANDAAKRHTVLLIGELGDEPDDPPVKVEVTGHLTLVGGADAHGLSVAVTPLKDGPSLVLAYVANPGKIEVNHPPEAKQLIVVVWAGGVRPMPGVTQQKHLLGYSVETTDGAVVPFAIGDLGDNDNYEYLYLDTEAKPLRVSMKEGLLMDPRDDPNPATSVEVADAVKP
nr:hypothetical protein [Nitrosomonas nitrosa]